MGEKSCLTCKNGEFLIEAPKNNSDEEAFMEKASLELQKKSYACHRRFLCEHKMFLVDEYACVSVIVFGIFVILFSIIFAILKSLAILAFSLVGIIMIVGGVLQIVFEKRKLAKEKQSFLVKKLYCAKLINLENKTKYYKLKFMFFAEGYNFVKTRRLELDEVKYFTDKEYFIVVYDDKSLKEMPIKLSFTQDISVEKEMEVENNAKLAEKEDNIQTKIQKIDEKVDGKTTYYCENVS